MKITAVQTIPIGRLRLVRVVTDEGVVGLGEIARDCHPATVAFAVRGMDLIGRDPLRIAAFCQDMTVGTYWRGGPIWASAVSAVEMALWDIKARYHGVPVNHLLGGPLRDSVPVYGHFHGSTPDEYAASAREVVSRGFRGCKTTPYPRRVRLKERELVLGDEVLADVAECMAATREAVGDSVRIMIDCHGVFNASTAIRAAESLAPFKPYYMEEIVPPENAAEMAKVARATNVPLATGERLYGREEFRRLLELQAVAFLQPDLCHCGGFGEGVRIAAMAEPYHVPVSPHNPNGVISTLVCLHLAAVVPNYDMLEIGSTVLHRQADEVTIFAPLPPIVDGAMAVPTSPGWGLELDESLLERFPPEE